MRGGGGETGPGPDMRGASEVGGEGVVDLRAACNTPRSVPRRTRGVHLPTARFDRARNDMPSRNDVFEECFKKMYT